MKGKLSILCDYAFFNNNTLNNEQFYFFHTLLFPLNSMIIFSLLSSQIHSSSFTFNFIFHVCDFLPQNPFLIL